MKKTICVDFDGVIHSYGSGWKGADVVSDPPVHGAMQWLKKLHDADFEVCIYSSRSKDPKGVVAMKDAIERWCDDEGVLLDVDTMLSFPTQKPPAWLTIDDRAICFTGVFPTVCQIEEFKPWNK